MTIREALVRGSKKLRRTSLSPVLDTEVLLSSVLRKDKTYLLANPASGLTKTQNNRLQKLVQKRKSRWPVAYLTGRKEFFGLDFKVTPDVLIPRPETETLIERALQLTTDDLLTGIIDIGTGSGNIIISLAKTLKTKSIKFFAIDFSPKALTIARQNANRHKVAGKIKFLRGNLLQPFLPPTTYKLPAKTIILANLPYLTPKQYAANPDLRHEPREALIAGRDGLKYFRKLFAQLAAAKSKKTTVFLEHDQSQKTKLRKLIRIYFPDAKVLFHKDLTGRYRIAEFSI